MRINDFHNILELIKQDVLHSEALRCITRRKNWWGRP